MTTASQNAVILGAAAVIVTYVIIRWKQKKTKTITWRPAGEISELHIYPLKSGRGVPLLEAECTDIGLKSTPAAPTELQNLKDRRLIVYNADTCKFVTCRNYPSLLLIKVTNGGDGVILLDAPNVPQFKLKLPDPISTPFTNLSMLFEEKVEAMDCGDDAANWIRLFLSKEESSLRIGYYKSQELNGIKNINIPSMDKFKKCYRRMKSEYTGPFKDLASFMILSESSLNDLKDKLPYHLKSITVKQFRPNIVIKGSKPYEEDNWEWIKIGDNVVLQGFKPCTSFQEDFQQIQEAKSKELESEPPVMGLYVGLDTAGIIKIGDPVYVSE
ncbi:hypothetical protein L9F63_001810 [Diploptera punctata]|uniref:MOSC domain-containing protein n=1 Tax=Diploptera punctata TaxID=6984 RepID=A0AAD8A2W3_DIPPU|nr:hypothetical protein L9F63_001810 [Diploptera punctata]